MRDRATLPIALPVVMRHGDGGWRAAPPLATMPDASPAPLAATRWCVPHFEFSLDDPSGSSLEASATRTLHALARFVQMALGSSRSARAAPAMEAVAATLVREERAW